MEKRMLSLAGAFLACSVIMPLVAEGSSSVTSIELQADYIFPNHEATDTSGFAPVAYGDVGGTVLQPRKVGSSWGGGELKGTIDHKLVFPFLVGNNPLTGGNNVSFDFIGEFSPVSANANFKAAITPIAFLRFEAGVGAGTGWDIGFIGLAVNNNGKMEPQSFGGVVYRAWLAGTFQFDLAAVIPGEWNHVVLLASPKVQYQAYSTAGSDQAWLWEADQGMNFNGFKLTGNYLLGYQMPIALDLVGFLLQPEGWLGTVREKSTIASNGWGSDFTYLTFGPLFDFKIDDRSSVAILPQFKTGIKWTDATAWRLYFGDRSYASPYTYFYRVAFDFTLKL
jgi:hypothetical protein